MNTNERLVQMLGLIKKDQKDICKEMQWNKNKITDIKSGKSSISLDDFIKLFDLYQKDIGAKNFVDCFSSNLVTSSNINIGSGNQNINTTANTDELKLLKYFRLLDEMAQSIALGEMAKIAKPFIKAEKEKNEKTQEKENTTENILGRIKTGEELDRILEYPSNDSEVIDIDFDKDNLDTISDDEMEFIKNYQETHTKKIKTHF